MAKIPQSSGGAGASVEVTHSQCQDGFCDTAQGYPVSDLDPRRVKPVRSDRIVHATKYVHDALVVAVDRRQVDTDTAISGAQCALTDTGVHIAPDDRTDDVGYSDVDEDHVPSPLTWRLSRTDNDLLGAPDAWETLQWLRINGFTAGRVSLDHVMQAAPLPTAGSGGRRTSLPGGREFMAHSLMPSQPQFMAHPGHNPAPMGAGRHWMPDDSLARVPVTCAIPDPAKNAAEPASGRRPTVVVMDTALGSHPWFSDPESTIRNLMVDGHPVSLLGDNPNDPLPCASERGDLAAQVQPYVGHGTFIAGLVRQQCPTARIISVPVLDGYGQVRESEVVRSLRLLLRQHQSAQRGGQGFFIDVITLSLGYYHEDPDDYIHTGVLAGILEACRRAGISIVTAAGNQSTTERLWPAGFADCSTDTTMAPLVSVGALNPGGESTAWYSNAGDWVTHHRQATNVVSTFDRRVSNFVSGMSQAPAQPESVLAYQGRRRSTVDLDEFGSGFAAWSGTSFAAPIVAGELAEVIAGDCANTGNESFASVTRAHHALKTIDRERFRHDDFC